MPRTGEASPVKGRRYERESYTAEEIRRLLAATSGKSPTALRNYALIVTLWQSGLRINEALELRPGDVTFESTEIFVRKAKRTRGGATRYRRVQCGDEALEAIQHWLAARSTLDLPAGAPLFCTLRGAKLHDTYVRAMLQRLAERAGWSKRIHPHGFRHTFAVNLARSGVPVAHIQRLLGHSSLATTSVYMSSITAEDLRESMERVTW